MKKENKQKKLTKLVSSCFCWSVFIHWTTPGLIDAFLHFIITLLPFTRAGFSKQTNIFRSYTQASHNWLFIVSYSCHSNQVATSKLTWYSHLLFQFLIPSSKLNETPAKIRQHVLYLFDPKFMRFKPLDKALKVE